MVFLFRVRYRSRFIPKRRRRKRCWRKWTSLDQLVTRITWFVVHRLSGSFVGRRLVTFARADHVNANQANDRDSNDSTWWMKWPIQFTHFDLIKKCQLDQIDSIRNFSFASRLGRKNDVWFFALLFFFFSISQLLFYALIRSLRRRSQRFDKIENFLACRILNWI